MSDRDPSSITVRLIESQHVPKVDATGKSELAKILIWWHGTRGPGQTRCDSPRFPQVAVQMTRIMIDSKVIAASLHPVTEAHISNRQLKKGNRNRDPNYVLHKFVPPNPLSFILTRSPLSAPTTR
jgi:hypothetical protein